MTVLTQDLIDRGLQLPPADRERFANLLLDSLDGPEANEEVGDPELQAELQRRWDRYQSGEDQAYSLEEVMAVIRKQIDSRKS